MDLRSWLLCELDDAGARLRGQVLELVPAQLRGERPGGGNSVAWATFHVARHAELALSVLTGAPGVERDGRAPGDGLDEGEQPWARRLEPAAVDAYATEALGAARRYLAAIDPSDLDAVPDTEAALERVGIPRDRYGWLYTMWSGQPAAFFVRWPLIGHVNNHVGEMIATRNRLGLSPF